MKAIIEVSKHSNVYQIDNGFCNNVGEVFIDKNDCEIIDEGTKMKLIEKELIEYLNNFVDRIVSDRDKVGSVNYYNIINDFVKEAKEKGWIKQSAIDKLFFHLSENYPNNTTLNLLINRAIKEAEEK